MKMWAPVLFFVTVVLALACFPQFSAVEGGLCYVAPQTAEASSPTVGMSVSALDVGQGDAILVRSAGHAMLVDAGSSSGAKQAVAYLKKLGIRKFDLVVATHPDADHIGGMWRIYRAFKVKKTLLSKKKSSTWTYKNFKRWVKREKCKVMTPELHKVYKLGRAKVKIVYDGSTNAGSNEASIILKVSYKKNSALLMADCSANIERMLAWKGELGRCKVLKVSHHGSAYSTTQALVNVVKPKISLISVGANSYGHPSRKIMKRLAQAKSKMYRTDIAGNVVVKFKSNGKVVTSAKACSWKSGKTNSSSSAATSDKKTNSSSSAATSGSVKYVYVTPYGTKYHRKSCSTIQKSTLTKLTRKKAKKLGYQACKVCF